MIQFISGDIVSDFKSEKINVLVHGCNCFHTMGAGLAKQVAKEFPAAYVSDVLTEYGDKEKLGSFSFHYVNLEKPLIVFNAYTQFSYGKKGTHASLAAIESCLADIHAFLNNAFPSKELIIGIPKIGCGLGGQLWENVLPIIEEEFSDSRFTIFIYGEKLLKQNHE